LIELGKINNLRSLTLASNDFLTLPDDMSFLSSLEEIDLSSNVGFSSDSVLVNPSKIFMSLATIPNLKKLNLSRNRFKAFHSEDFPQDNLNEE
jgi:Leucine-rich repeat (LRR) protein